MCVFVCACVGFCVVRWWLCWHQPHWMKLILEVVLVFNRQINTGAHTQTQEHHHVVTSTHAQRQTVLGHLVCLLVWVSLWGRVQLVWQQDTDSQTILIFASLLYVCVCTCTQKHTHTQHVYLGLKNSVLPIAIISLSSAFFFKVTLYSLIPLLSMFFIEIPNL